MGKSYFYFQFILGIFLFLMSLYFQHARGFEPCVLCIYQRILVVAIAILGLLGVFIQSRLMSIFWIFVVAGVNFFAFLLASYHVNIQQGKVIGQCTYDVGYPAWLPLDSWVPAIFQATGSCMEVSWSFFSQSMPQTLSYIFIFSSIFGIIALTHQIFFAKKNRLGNSSNTIRMDL